MSDKQDAIMRREVLAFNLVSKEIKRILDDGYKIHPINNPMQLKFDMAFVGPDNGNMKPEVRVLTIPYALMHVLFKGNDSPLCVRWRACCQKIHEVSREMYDIIIDSMMDTMGEEDHGKTSQN